MVICIKRTCSRRCGWGRESVRESGAQRHLSLFIMPFCASAMLSSSSAHPNTHLTESTKEKYHAEPQSGGSCIHFQITHIELVCGSEGERAAKYSAGHLKLRFSKWPSSWWCDAYKGLLPGLWTRINESCVAAESEWQSGLSIEPIYLPGGPAASWIFNHKVLDAWNINLCQKSKESDRL